MAKIIITALILLLSSAGSASAIQQHGGAEGYYAHQIAHLAFAAGMVYLIVVLKRPAIAHLAGWRCIRIASLLFLLWNLDAFISHMAEESLLPVAAYFDRKRGVMSVSDLKSSVYYATRVAEYFFLVPAFLFLAVGIQRLKRQLEQEPGP